MGIQLNTNEKMIENDRTSESLTLQSKVPDLEGRDVQGYNSLSK